MMRTTAPSNPFTFPYHFFNKYNFNDCSRTYFFKKNEEIPLELIHFSKVSIILKGIVYLYWKNNDNEMTIIDFKNIGQVLRPAVNITHTNSKIYARCIKDCEIIVFTRDFLCQASLTSPQISAFYFNLLNEDITATYKQLRVLKNFDIEERYKMFLKEYKYIFNEISDRQVANYLGVHYTTLSRVKSRIFSKHKSFK